MTADAVLINLCSDETVPGSSQNVSPVHQDSDGFQLLSDLSEDVPLQVVEDAAGPRKRRKTSPIKETRLDGSASRPNGTEFLEDVQDSSDREQPGNARRDTGEFVTLRSSSLPSSPGIRASLTKEHNHVNILDTPERDPTRKQVSGRPTLTTGLSARTAELLADLSKSSTVELGASRSRTLPERTSRSRCRDDDSRQETVSRPPTGLTSGASLSKSEEKALERERAKREKAAQKEADKEQKRLAKEEKARQKQEAAELADVNKARTDKKITATEMIVDLPASIKSKALDEQLRSSFGNLGVETAQYPCPYGQIIKWRRRVKARFNDELGHWEPCPPEVKHEKIILCLLNAKDFVDLSCNNGKDDIDSYVEELRGHFRDHRILFLIEGLATWMRKNKNVRNQAYRAAVREQMEPSEGSQTARRTKRRHPPEYIDEDMIEDALLQLQIVHKCLIHQTTSIANTAEWCVNFTQHISSIPYKTERMNLDTSFCMDVGQVRTGENAADTFVKMLQEIVRVTPSIAYGIAGAYPDVQSLAKGLHQKGPLALQDLKKMANRDGAPTTANIGPAISRRIYKIFTGVDPTSNDV